MKNKLSPALVLGLAVAPGLALAQDYGSGQENDRSQQHGEDMERSGQRGSKMKEHGSKMDRSKHHGSKKGYGSDTKANGQKKTSSMTKFRKFDADGDGQISKIELRTGIGPLFDDWDYDANDELVDLEIVHGMFNAWDVDGDDEIDEVEFTNGKTMWLPDDASVYYGDFDLDGREEVSLTEFATGLDTSEIEVYNLDAEAPLTSYELADAILAVYDDDRDGELSKKEWPLS